MFEHPIAQLVAAATDQAQDRRPVVGIAAFALAFIGTSTRWVGRVAMRPTFFPGVLIRLIGFEGGPTHHLAGESVIEIGLDLLADLAQAFAIEVKLAGESGGTFERIWAALKAWLANSPTLTIQGRVRQVHAFFRQRSPAQLLATAAPHSSPWLPEGYVQNFREAA